MAKVGTDQRKGHEVTIHGHLLAALVKHLLKDTRKEAVGGKRKKKKKQQIGEEKDKKGKLKRGKKMRGVTKPIGNSPENGQVRCLLQQLVYIVHHPGVELDHVHHLR